MIISVTCYKIWGHVNGLSSCVCRHPVKHKRELCMFKMCFIPTYRRTVRGIVNVTTSLLQLHEAYLPTYSECLSSVWGKKSFTEYIQPPCYIDAQLKMAFPITSINYFHRGIPSLSCHVAHSLRDGIFWKAGPVGLLFLKLNRTSAA